MKLIKTIFILLLAISSFSFTSETMAGACDKGFVNPVTDISWQCIFPISLGGLVKKNSNVPTDSDKISTPLCYCNTGGSMSAGLSMSFWEPSRMIDTVSNPMCFMAMGQKLANPSPGQLGGDLTRTNTGSKAFQQMHYYIFPAWAVMNMFLDLPCLDKKAFDVAMVSEVLPNWNNEVTGMLLNPEAVMFGNPAAQLACAADAAAVLGGSSIDALFWCQGSWPSVYPLSGSITSTDYVEANAGLAGRALFMMTRLGMINDPAESMCGSVPVKMWRKSHYRLQLAKPVKDSSCQPIGRTGLAWTHAKNPAMSGDNFAWIVFRKVKCCVSYF